MSDVLLNIRKGIDEVDDEIASLLCKRAELAREVKNIKKGNQINTYAPNREKEIIDRVLPACLSAGYSKEQVEDVFLSIISSCRAIIGDIEVSVKGFPGSRSYAAAIKQFGHMKNIVCVSENEEMFSRLSQGFSQFILLQFSDGDTGISDDTLNYLISNECKIISDRTLSEEYSVYSYSMDLSKISTLYGESEALFSVSNSRSFSEFSKQLALSVLPSELCSIESVKDFLKNNLSSALIATPNLTQGLDKTIDIPCVLEKVHLKNARKPRFYVIGKDACPAGSNYLTSMVCALKDTGGALRELLEPFSKNNINLLTLESKYPKGAAWECMFFLEFEGGVHEASVQSALKEIEKICTFSKVFGSFPSVKE